MNHTLKIFLIPILMLLSCFATYGMEQKPIKIQVEDKIYELTLKQAQQSEKLQEILKKQTELEEPITLPSSITPEVFDYIYKDLTDQSYDVNDLDDKMIGALYNAAFYLKIPWLKEKYTDITTDRITDITLEVGGKEYIVTVEQAKRSKTLKNILNDVEDYTIPIPLPDTLQGVFAYVYKDLTNTDYDSDSLSVETLVDLVNAANYLDALKLLEKYQNLLAERLTAIDSKNIENYIRALQELPEEMQVPLSQRINAESLAIFKKLSQSKVKRVPEIQYFLQKMTMSPDKTKAILKYKQKFKLVDLITNTIVWKKKFSDAEILFSSDSTKIAVFSQLELQIFSTKGEKVLLNKRFISKLFPVGFFSDINRIILVDNTSKEFIVLDAGTGAVLFKVQLPGVNFVKNCYYDPESQVICLKVESIQNYVLVVDIKKGTTIKTRTDTKSEHFDIFPDCKKIISLSRELVSIENSFNDGETILWPFETPLSSIPRVGTFSADSSSLSILSRKTPYSHNATIFVFDNRGKMLWDRSNVETDSTLFSPNAQLFTIKSQGLITNINVKLKNEAWSKVYFEKIKDVYYISDDVLAVCLDSKIIFNDSKTGEFLNEIKYEGYSSLHFEGISKNNLFLSDRGKGNKLFCIDISPLNILYFLDHFYISLDQALLIYYGFKMIQNNKIIVIPQSLKEIYDDLPQEIKSLIEDYKPIDIKIRGTIPLKKLPQSRFGRLSKD